MVQKRAKSPNCLLYSASVSFLILCFVIFATRRLPGSGQRLRTHSPKSGFRPLADDEKLHAELTEATPQDDASLLTEEEEGKDPNAGEPSEPNSSPGGDSAAKKHFDSPTEVKPSWTCPAS